ncbi:MAG: hypothetical protein A4S17_10180 [Proteobacteria bacterium HN_bin10]|nr:MAG: hypothetical protein A4S17_10180 [Proteobacteria bacterium HN_bin10]
MKKTLFAAALAAIAAFAAAPLAAAQDRDYRNGGYGDDYRHRDYDRDYQRDRDRDWDRNWRRGDHLRNMGAITIRNDGRVFTFTRGDRLFYRLIDRPYNFVPGLTYSYTDRCNRWGCVAFVTAPGMRRPIDRIFAPHLPLRTYAWRGQRGFDQGYRSYGYYDRDDRRFDDQWRYSDDYRWDENDRRWNEYDLEGGRREHMR